MELNNLRAMASCSARETESGLISSLSLLALPPSLLPLSKCVFNFLLDLAPASSLSDPELVRTECFYRLCNE
ncbi:hypothetical protein C5167_039261 [Papaver somniferum]|uniref:Uncharacterized protein n=1 Tax=Papaver somniferum TaxID=3469 RepID=A0A4Y7IF58_PAPSO|nr:hypothetical protein C5167_039261 [Papaver somniferum]